jgi:ectoine hydroxylase-related dioxygenase (phytanoyl-CoA dioxygenase family)
MESDGYLYLPGFFERDEVQRVRSVILKALSEDGALDPSRPIEDAVPASSSANCFRPDIANGAAKAELAEVIYGDKIMQFYRDLLGMEARHFDYTWMRVVAPGQGTWPHCDSVYMGRGTTNVFTAWVPFSDIPLNVGGLAIMEGSHHDERLRATYCPLDVDTACSNVPDTNQLGAAGYKPWGAINHDMPELRRELGYRMLTAETFKMGDLLTFSIFTVHGSLDNCSDHFRLSTDSRYQPAHEPIDERWIGENPPGHGGNMIRGLIC